MTVNWTGIRKMLKDAPNDILIELIKKLYDLSDENKALIRTTFSPGQPDLQLLEKSRKQVIRLIYPGSSGIPHNPRFADSRKVIHAYQKATGDIAGTLDLMLTHVEVGTEFTIDFGDIDEPFYTALANMLANTIDLMCKSPNAAGLYEQLKPRFKHLKKSTSEMGWGFGDEVSEMEDGLEEKFQTE